MTKEETRNLIIETLEAWRDLTVAGNKVWQLMESICDDLENRGMSTHYQGRSIYYHDVKLATIKAYHDKYSCVEGPQLSVDTYKLFI